MKLRRITTRTPITRTMLLGTTILSITGILGAGAGVLLAQRGPGPGPGGPGGGLPIVNPEPNPSTASLGQPIPAISSTDLAAFNAGKTEFLEVEDVSDGLGPAYNGTSCSVCHNIGGIGGVGNQSVIRAGTLTNGVFTEPQGGSLVHRFSIPNHQCQPRIPGDANVVIERIPLQIFGDGLVEAIPDATIQALANQPNQDGVRGRVALVTDPASKTTRVGRFGWKAQQATLLGFAGDAYRNEMGITNDLFPDEVGTGLTTAQLATCNSAPGIPTGIQDKVDPVTHTRGIDRLSNFMRFLAPPVPGAEPGGGTHGAQVFAQIGCAVCHVPTLTTGPSSDPALDRKPVTAFSDFLLHDIGTGDGIAQGAAQPNEIKTAPLWGLRFRKLLMHDGSSITLIDSIRRHGGDSARSTQRFNNLSPQDQQAVLNFLSVL